MSSGYKRRDFEQFRLETALLDGKWADKPLNIGQIDAVYAVVKANALNESDYQLLKEILGLK